MLTKLSDTIQKQRYDRAKELAAQIKNGDVVAAKELISIFNPLIRKTCSTLYIRYHKLVPMQDLLTDGASILVYLVGVEYDLNGAAHIGRFIKTHLHARLVQMYRPIMRNRCVEEELDKNGDYLKEDSINKEMVEDTIEALNEFMWNTFNEKELNVIVNHVIYGNSRNTIAEMYNLSYVRMKQIHMNTIKKLRKFLQSRGIYSIRDIYEKY